MAIIKTKKGEEIMVDDGDYERLSKFVWYTNQGYVCRKIVIDGKQTVALMHREIMNTPTGQVTDHANGNKLDNRRCNLRICSHADNMKNCKRRSNNTTGFCGVVKRMDGKAFIAQIRIGKRVTYLGAFPTAHEAHKAYIAASLKHFGAFSPYATGRQQ